MSLARPHRLIVAAWIASASLPVLASQPSQAAQASPTAPSLQAFTAHYQASAMGMKGQATMTLEAVDPATRQWRYTLTVRNPLARVRQSTVFTQTGDTLQPLHTVSATRLLTQERTVEGHYDWSARVATWTGDARAHRRGPVALEPGDMDGLLINLAVMRDLAQNRPLHYRMVDNGHATILDYRVTGTQSMTVQGKPVQVTRIERTTDDKQQIAWIAPDLPAPVRLLQREGGKDTLELVLTP